MAPPPASDAVSAHYAPCGTQEAPYGDFTTYSGYDTNGFDPTGSGTSAPAAAAFATDPLFGDLSGSGHDPAAYATGDWSAGGHDTAYYDAYPAQQQAASYDTGGYDATVWTTGQQLPTVPPQAAAPDASGQWDAGAWLQPDQAQSIPDPTQQWHWGTQTFDTGAYDATQWNSDGGGTATQVSESYEASSHEHQAVPFDQQATATFERHPDLRSSTTTPSPAFNSQESERHLHEVPYEDPYESAHDTPDDAGEPPAVAPLLDEQEEPTPLPAPRAASRGGSRSRRRTPAKRSALLTVAVPSVCVMGVAGIAAASVGDLTEDGGSPETRTTAADPPPVQPATVNNELNTQLESLSAGANDFADRASRTQERIDLKVQQEADRKAAAEEAARKERLRPKFALPVAQHGLSAYYGQSGINWMSVHSGIDFPVSYGAPVMAATDGTVRTQYNSAYGNMMIVTAMDGTETWYCHLSSYQLPSGTAVKAGQPIAFSGNSGNSTGPHLHFEVRPGGGSAIDPLAWFRSHGLDPT